MILEVLLLSLENVEFPLEEVLVMEVDFLDGDFVLEDGVAHKLDHCHFGAVFIPGTEASNSGETSRKLHGIETRQDDFKEPLGADVSE
eukprot:CAMPEP_0170491754 /NCGR_PEP_ID=MMETSP0208-20121228/11235_1 /TAXON_ID=197538 /ORGANISM="Strombidium inclinatum, Strain S3" /LENGTH=87 /DNA_ID=CAMNT_0010767379 /DNA_START=245 /DNA_END=508 /DNA_ORIENTATION=+